MADTDFNARRDEIIAEFEARKDARVYPVRSDYATKAEFKAANKAADEEYDNFNRDIVAAMEVVFFDGEDNDELDEVADGVLELAENSEYGSSVRGFVSAYFEVAELVLRAYKIGKKA